MPGTERGAEPVAMRTCLAASSVSDPSASATPILAALRKRPSPMKTSILFLRISAWTPLYSCSTTRALRRCTASRSTATLSTVSPSSRGSFRCSRSSAVCSMAFVGMHPMCRQVPPTFSRSTSATLSPSCAARIAPTYPPGPLPMTMRSYASGIAGMSSVRLVNQMPGHRAERFPPGKPLLRPVPVVHGIFPQSPAQEVSCPTELRREVHEPRLRVPHHAADLVEAPQDLRHFLRLGIQVLLARSDLIEHAIPGFQALPAHVQALR